MCLIRLFNTSLIHIFHRTQVFRIVQKFSKIFDQNVLSQKHVLTIFALLPHSQPKFFSFQKVL